MIKMDAEQDNQSTTEMNEDLIVNPDTGLENRNNITILWYSASTKYGTICIGLYKNEADLLNHSIYESTVLENIIMLSREERMIQLLEDWLQVGLDLRPSPIITGEFYTFKLSDHNRVAKNIKNKIIVKVEKQAIDQIPVPKWHSDISIYLTSDDVFANLVLSNNSIDNSYQDSLTENSILMIPESFLDGWIGYARSQEITSGKVSINLGRNLQTISINNEIQIPDSIDIQNDNTDADYLTVSINGAVKIPFHYLLGWTNSGSFIIAKPLSFYPISINKGNSCIAVGRLVSISNGYGIHINKVH
jgi:hypothetical protein